MRSNVFRMHIKSQEFLAVLLCIQKNVFACKKHENPVQKSKFKMDILPENLRKSSIVPELEILGIFILGIFLKGFFRDFSSINCRQFIDGGVARTRRRAGNPWPYIGYAGTTCPSSPHSIL